LEIKFPEIKYYYTFENKRNARKIPFNIKIGLQHLINDLADGELKYSPLFFQNLGYGVQVWFGPNGWDDNRTKFFGETCEN
jgi:hypothetical protein